MMPRSQRQGPLTYCSAFFELPYHKINLPHDAAFLGKSFLVFIKPGDLIEFMDVLKKTKDRVSYPVSL